MFTWHKHEIFPKKKFNVIFESVENAFPFYCTNAFDCHNGENETTFWSHAKFLSFSQGVLNLIISPNSHLHNFFGHSIQFSLSWLHIKIVFPIVNLSPTLKHHSYVYQMCRCLEFSSKFHVLYTQFKIILLM